MTTSNETNATIARASLIALLIITPNRIPMMNVVTERTEVMVVRSRPFAIFEPYSLRSTGIRGYTGEKSQGCLKGLVFAARCFIESKQVGSLS